MAQDTQQVTSALIQLTDRAFVDALSSRDQQAMSEFIADFFCEDPETDLSSEEEEEPCTYTLYIACNFIPLKMFYNCSDGG